MDGGSNMMKAKYIPAELHAQILPKLPLKSILRFKIACKTWYSLISNRVFINLHSQQTSQNPKTLHSTHGYGGYQLLDYDSSSFDDCCLSGPINFPGLNYCHPKVVGSSCGLVCLGTNMLRDGFVIWNPLTKEHRKVPDLSMKADNYNYFHGLGYDSVANDVKLVVSSDRISYNIFSLKANSWKTITCPIAYEYYHPNASHETLHGILYWHSLAIVLNGIFHWIVAPANYDPEIVAFDVSNETFQKLQFPQNVPVGANLLEHKGSLCVSFGKKGLSCSYVREIWMMKKEYYDWIHLITINNPPDRNYSLPVLCISTRDEVVFHTDEKFSRCGEKEMDKLDKIGVHAYKAVAYVETLLSPNTHEFS